MKKQLLLLIVVLFAISFSTALAQTASNAPSCTATALTPAAGAMYNYAATISGVASYTGNGNFKWYVTKNVNLISGAVEPAGASDDIVASGTTYNSNVAGPGGNNINILWTSASLATGVPYYLVVRYEEPNESGTGTCTSMNMKVYRIVPQNTFWLKIESVADATGTPGGDDQCAADVTGALMTEGAAPTVEYTYGQNVLYVKITASSYVGNWTPSLRITGAVADQSISAGGITWKSGTTSGAFACAGACTDGNGIYTSNNPMPSTLAGTEIIVTIPIDNNHHEGLADQTIAVAIDGSYISGTKTFNDKSDVNGACTDAAAFEDTINKNIKARPGINGVAPSTFVTELPHQP